jgi:hypothetical protein
VPLRQILPLDTPLGGAQLMNDEPRMTRIIADQTRQID